MSPWAHRSWSFCEPSFGERWFGTLPKGDSRDTPRTRRALFAVWLACSLCALFLGSLGFFLTSGQSQWKADPVVIKHGVTRVILGKGAPKAEKLALCARQCILKWAGQVLELIKREIIFQATQVADRKRECFYFLFSVFNTDLLNNNELSSPFL